MDNPISIYLDIKLWIVDTLARYIFGYQAMDTLASYIFDIKPWTSSKVYTFKPWISS